MCVELGQVRSLAGGCQPAPDSGAFLRLADLIGPPRQWQCAPSSGQIFVGLRVLQCSFFSVKMFSPRTDRDENVVFVSPHKQFLRFLMKGMAL